MCIRDRYIFCCREHQKKWLQLFEETEMKYKECILKLHKQLESEHLIDLTFHKFQYASECEEEKAELQYNFKKWYMETADKEIKTRDTKIKDLQKVIEMCIRDRTCSLQVAYISKPYT